MPLKHEHHEFAHEYRAAEPIMLAKNKIDEYASQISNHFHYALNGNIEGVLENLGGEVRYISFLSNQDTDSGSLFVDSENDFTIYISNTTTAQRDSFTIAHEIGHYILHYINAPRDYFVNCRGLKANRYTQRRDRAEWEANWFAAGFLMPRGEFVLRYNRLQSISQVSSSFGVSQSAAQVRADYLLSEGDLTEI